MPITSPACHRLRRWTYTPIVAAIAAGAVCTDVGIGSATTDIAAATTATATPFPGTATTTPTVATDQTAPDTAPAVPSEPIVPAVPSEPIDIDSVVGVTLSKIGAPYAEGGTGPSVFDGPGLVKYAYTHAGVPLPGTALAQAAAGTPVAVSDLRPATSCPSPASPANSTRTCTASTPATGCWSLPAIRSWILQARPGCGLWTLPCGVSRERYSVHGATDAPGGSH